MSDTQDAAERLRRYYVDDELPESVYPEKNWEARLEADHELVFGKAGDGEPMDEAWLLSVGFKFHDALNQYAAGNGSGVRLVYWPGIKQQPNSQWFIEGPDRAMAEIPKRKTRGDVRRLCVALGIELKEGEQS